MISKETTILYKNDSTTHVGRINLCREFRLMGTLKGATFELLHVTDNRKRCHHIQLDRELDSLTLIPIETWGQAIVSLISFDFR